MAKVLWIIGAGASYHLGMPLLAHFEAFFNELLKFPENQRDLEFQATLNPSLALLRKYPDKNIEDLLSLRSPISSEEKGILKRAIRRGFERRNLGRIWKVFGPHGKLGPFSHLLCQVELGDAIVSFNYDNAMEAPLCLSHNDYSMLNKSELTSAQMEYLSDGRAARRWIPTSCISSLQQRSLEYVPAAIFDAKAERTVGTSAETIPFMKIHGSVNWFRSGEKIQVGDPAGEYSAPMIVYPEAAKPELLQPPHRLLIEQSMKELSSCKVVVIVGYSFPRSDAEGHPFVSELANSLISKRVLVIDPFPSENIRSLVKGSDIFQATFEEAIQPDRTGVSDLQREVANRR